MLTNVALGKPVVSIGRNLIIDEKGVILEKGDLYPCNSFNVVYSVNQGHYPSNLTDGREDTKAYPAHYYFDYVVDLGRVYEIQSVLLVWGNYCGPDHITGWNLYKQEKLCNDWNRVGSGKNPGVSRTPVDGIILARRLRVSAESVRDGKVLNWIGVVGLEAYADEAQDG